MYKPEEDIDFINKRISEQLNYIRELRLNPIYTFERYCELRDSAYSQLEYFEKLKEQYESRNK